MNSFIIREVFLIVMGVSVVLSLTFCNDSQPTERLFFIGNNNFIQKGSKSYYRSAEDMAFKSSVGIDVKEYFKIDFQRIYTGFAITQIPFDCNKVDDNCNDLRSVLNIAFIIADIAQFSGQAYVSYRVDTLDNEVSLNLITSPLDMPFKMMPVSALGKPFWPIKADKNSVYLHSAYVELEYRLVLLILRNGEQLLYMTSLREKGWYEHWTYIGRPLLFGSSTHNLGRILGFYMRFETVFALTTRDSNTEPLIAMLSDKDFVAKPMYSLDEKLYGCESQLKTTVRHSTLPLNTTTKPLTKQNQSFDITDTVVQKTSTVMKRMTTTLTTNSSSNSLPNLSTNSSTTSSTTLLSAIASEELMKRSEQTITGLTIKSLFIVLIISLIIVVIVYTTRKVFPRES